MITMSPRSAYGEYKRVGRFGGWQAQWLASVIMMTGDGVGTDNGMRYSRTIHTPVPPGRIASRSGAFVDKSGNWYHTSDTSAEIYTIGIVDIDEAWLIALIPDIARRDKFLKGDERGFFAEG